MHLLTCAITVKDKSVVFPHGPNLFENLCPSSQVCGPVGLASPHRVRLDGAFSGVPDVNAVGVTYHQTGAITDRHKGQVTSRRTGQG